MSNTLRVLGVTAFLALSACALVPSQASAMSMSDCSAAWKAAKAANNVPAGMTWNTFRSGGCTIPAAAAAAPAAPAATAAKTTTAAAAPAATPSGSFLKDCSANWAAMKKAGTVPAGMDWKSYLASKCPAPAAAAAPAAPAAPAATPAKASKTTSMAPPEPTTDDNTPVATTDKNGKPLTAGQIAAHKRIKACGAQWRAMKAANKTPAGMAWPQYWSQCNKDLKAKGM